MATSRSFSYIFDEIQDDCHDGIQKMHVRMAKTVFSILFDGNVSAEPSPFGRFLGRKTEGEMRS